jgi:hypothetical protein
MGVIVARLRLAPAGKTTFPPRAPFFRERGGTSRFPRTPLPTITPEWPEREVSELGWA